MWFARAGDLEDQNLAILNLIRGLNEASPSRFPRAVIGDSLAASGGFDAAKEAGMGGRPDLFRARLDQIINMKHELVRLALTVDWAFIDGQLSECFSEQGRPAVPTRFKLEAV